MSAGHDHINSGTDELSNQPRPYMSVHNVRHEPPPCLSSLIKVVCWLCVSIPVPCLVRKDWAATAAATDATVFITHLWPWNIPSAGEHSPPQWFVSEAGGGLGPRNNSGRKKSSTKDEMKIKRAEGDVKARQIKPNPQTLSAASSPLLVKSRSAASIITNLLPRPAEQWQHTHPPQQH